MNRHGTFGRLVSYAASAAVLSGAAGCASLDEASGPERTASTTVTPADFVGTPDPEPQAPAVAAASPKKNTAANVRSGETITPPSSTTPPARSSPRPSTIASSAGGVLPLTGSPTDMPAQAGGAGVAPGVNENARVASGAVVLEAHVGQVNGKPIFASEILEPLDGRLRALGGESKTREQWQRGAGKSIYDELIRRVRDELVLAEARANLTTEQRQGLVYFLGEIQKNLVAGNRGSEVLADEKLRESTSRSLQKETQDQLDRELIANELRSRVVPRVAVPWRDVQLEYERNFEKYNPPPIAHFRMIIVDTKNAEAVEKIGASLGSGLSFGEVASQRPNEFNRPKGGEFDREFSGAFGEAKFSEIKEINDVMQRATPGQTIGPVTYRDKTAWVHLEQIENRPGQTLYEAQYQIEQELRDERFRIEEQRYFDNLLKRGNVTKFEDMMAKLLAIAQERYMPASLAQQPSTRPAPTRPQR